MTQPQQNKTAWTKWQELFSEQARSGQSAKAFCRERGLREWQFYAWKKRIRDAEAEKFVEVKLAAASSERRNHAPVLGAGIEIRLSKGRSLVVEPGFDAQHLRSVLAILETV